MRQLIELRCVRGVTLVELLVTMAVLSILVTLGLPAMSDYLRNARLSESAHTVMATAIFARSEAIKRNETLRLELSGGELRVRTAEDEVLRSQMLPDGIAVAAASVASGDAVSAIQFGGSGRTVPFGASFRIDASLAGASCEDPETRCPRVMVRSGGALQKCLGQEDC